MAYIKLFIVEGFGGGREEPNICFGGDAACVEGGKKGDTTPVVVM